MNLVLKAHSSFCYFRILFFTLRFIHKYTIYDLKLMFALDQSINLRHSAEKQHNEDS